MQAMDRWRQLERQREADKNDRLLGPLLHNLTLQHGVVQTVTEYYFEEALGVSRFAHRFRSTVDTFAARHNLICESSKDGGEFYLIKFKR